MEESQNQERPSSIGDRYAQVRAERGATQRAERAVASGPAPDLNAGSVTRSVIFTNLPFYFGAYFATAHVGGLFTGFALGMACWAIGTAITASGMIAAVQRIVATAKGMIFDGHVFDRRAFMEWPPQIRRAFFLLPVLSLWWLIMGVILPSLTTLQIFGVIAAIGGFWLPMAAGAFNAKIADWLHGRNIRGQLHESLRAGAKAAPVGGSQERPKVEAETKTAQVAEEVRQHATEIRAPRAPEPLAVTVGISSGALAEIGHTNAIAFGSPITLHEVDLRKNFFGFGETGSGKTSRLATPQLAQLAHQKAGGLGIDTAKNGVLVSKVKRVCEIEGRPCVTFGWSGLPWNPLAGQSPELSGEDLKALLTRSGHSTGDKETWINAAVNTIVPAIGLLSFFEDGRYLTLTNLDRFVNAAPLTAEEEERFAALAPPMPAEDDQDAKVEAFDFQTVVKRMAVETAMAARKRGDTKTERWVRAYLSGWQKYEEYDSRLRSSIRFSVNEITAPFTNPDMEDRFSVERNGFDLADAMNKGTIFVLHAPSATMGDVGAQVIATLAKKRFMRMMLQRPTSTEWNQDRFVFLLLDEFTRSLVLTHDDASDLNYYALSRESNTGTFAFTQSVSTLRSAVGDDARTNMILQAFVNKATFRTTDPMTIGWFQSYFGEYEFQKVTSSQGQNEGWSDNGGSGGQNVGVSVTTERRKPIDAKIIGSFHDGQAIGTFSIDDRPMDDMFVAEAVFV